MTNDKLAQHISNELWVQKSKVVEVLGKFEEKHPQPDKHPIERVNAKYPNGWYCEAFKEVREDMAEVTGKPLFTGKWHYYGWRPKGLDNDGYLAALYNLSKYCNNTLITKSEYLAITRGIMETLQEETPTIHASKPSDVTLQERVKALELIVNEMRKDKECPHIEEPTLKRNLYIDTHTIDWKKGVLYRFLNQTESGFSSTVKS
jgi:hypothetical protein